ncbi:MAG: ribosome small subunit-dependent GTPase A [Clostridia bacterium]|nr:ribosome small subunit-dependent GTPase A [Clostridia bacterium]
MTKYGEVNAKPAGKMYYASDDETSLPSVGDFVGMVCNENRGDSVISEILPRKSVFVRRAAGISNRPQTLAANFDYVFIVTSMNLDFNISRIDRYVALAWESGGIPVIILSKADLCGDRAEIISEISKSHPGVDFHMVSIVTGEGMEELAAYFKGNRTVVFLGSSGVGKSSLLNYLSARKMMEVKELRNGIEKGRHTTTHRELFILPGGGVVIDTPGMRELGLWHAGDGVEKGFAEITACIAALAQNCRFSDCGHSGEPGCAVAEALENGGLDADAYERYMKLRKESMFMETKISEKATYESRKKQRQFSKMIKNMKKETW